MAGSTPVYIGKLLFENYRSFNGRNEISLIDAGDCLYQWTVFLGNNNTGKTNLLKAIADLEPEVHELDDENGQEIKYHYPKGNYLTKSVHGKISEVVDDTFIGLKIFAENEPTLERISNKKIYELEYSDGEPEFLGASFWGFSPGKFWKGFSNENIEGFTIYSYGVTRRIGDTRISEDIKEAYADSLFNPDHKLTNVEEWFFQLKFAAQNGQPAAEIRLQLLKEIIKSEILPEILNFEFRTTKSLKNYIEYKTKEGWFKFDELGYGYQTTISWIFDLCKKMFERYPDSKNPLKEPAIVLVDELDLHLHPKWQKTIVSYLSKTFPCTQFIVTTHSPLILQTIEKVNLFALVKEEDRVNIKHIPVQSFEGWSVEEILAEVMEMEDGIFSDKHNKLFKEFDDALNNEDYLNAKIAYEKLLGILHPDSEKRTILKLQLSQIEPVNDKA